MPRRRTGPPPSRRRPAARSRAWSRSSLDRLLHGVAHAGHELDGVGEQLLVQPGRVGDQCRPRSISSAPRFTRSRELLSTSASSHSIPTVGRGEAWKSTRTRQAKHTPATRWRQYTVGVRVSMATMLDSADPEPDVGLLPQGRRAPAVLGRGRRRRDGDDAGLSWQLGVRNPEIDVTFTALSMSYQADPEEPIVLQVRHVKQRDIDYEDLTLVDHLVRDVVTGRGRTSTRRGRAGPDRVVGPQPARAGRSRSGGG